MKHFFPLIPFRIFCISVRIHTFVASFFFVVVFTTIVFLESVSFVRIPRLQNHVGCLHFYLSLSFHCFDSIPFHYLFLVLLLCCIIVQCIPSVPAIDCFIHLFRSSLRSCYDLRDGRANVQHNATQRNPTNRPTDDID